MHVPFEGVRVLEVTAGIAGSYCGRLLADAGADVVKIEPARGDPLRRWSATGVELGPSESGALFRFLAAGKRSVVSGSAAAPGTAELFRGADLLVFDGSGGWDAAAVTRLAGERSDAVVVSISPFGLTGPYADPDQPLNEFVLQAMCGSLGSRGLPEGRPIQAGGRIGEWVTGCYAAVAAAATWRRASRTGAGELIDVSMLESMISTMGGGLGAASLSVLGPDTATTGRTVELPSIVQTADGLVGFCTITGQQFRDFLVLIDRFDLIDDADLASFAGRLRRREEFQQMVDDWAGKRTTAEIIELASALRIPVAPIGSPETVVEIDHFRERGVFVKNPAGFVQPRPPYRSDQLTVAEVSESPPLGQHSGAVEWPERITRPARSSGSRRPLTGVRVLDFTAFWAGPAATQLLAGLGADVIKVEGLRRPDGMRFSGGQPAGAEQWWERGPVYLACNGGKRGITLELSKPEARDVALRLAGQCDVVIENFSPRVMSGLGIDWPDLHAANPRLVVVRMPAFGLDGPWRDRVGFAQTMEQASGMAWVTGEADGPPLIPRGPCDPIAGLHAAFVTIAGLEVRDRTGRGMQIESTMVEAALNVAAEVSIEFSAYGRSVVRDGNRGPDAAPQGVYRCAGDDAWVALSIVTSRQWAGLCRLLGGRPPVAAGASLDEFGERRAHADQIDHWIEAWTAVRNATTIVAALREAGIPAAVVSGPAQLLADPQLAHRGFWEHVAHPVAGEVDLPGLPFRFAGLDEPWTVSAPPLLGQHNHEVLTGLLDMTEDEVSMLESRSVIGTRPTGW
jgi:crotonobetainyl-CoA:carnitine CoA-transferase CaiB-like acyl-CoA transferase